MLITKTYIEQVSGDFKIKFRKKNYVTTAVIEYDVAGLKVPNFQRILCYASYLTCPYCITGKAVPETLHFSFLLRR